MKHNRGLFAVIASLALAIIVGVVGFFVVATPNRSSESDPLATFAPANDPQLEFLYIDKNAVSADEEQAIAVAFDEATVPNASTIQLTHQSSGEERTFTASNLNDHAALFTFPASELESGTWDVTAVDGNAGAEAFTISLADEDAEGLKRFDVLDAEPITVADTEASEAAEAVETPQAVEADPPDEETKIYVTQGDELIEAANMDDALALAAKEAANADAGIATAANGVVKVALDPGHGGYDSGAVGVAGAYESNLNWKISNYCKQELDQYSGVATYLTRSENECPSIYDRVKRAIDWGADVVVSQHLNSYNGQAAGAEVYIPNGSSYNYHVHSEGERLGTAIIDQLAGLGLYRRGVKVRDLVYETYADGASIADYYGITRYARQFGITGIIVEHAFIDTPNDYWNFLADEGKLQALGVADAHGVANAYGLRKGPAWTWAPQVTAALSGDSMTADVRIFGAAAPGEIEGVDIAFKRDADVKRFTANRDANGEWTASVPLRSLHDAGDYTVEIIARSGGSEASVASTTFNVPTTVNGSLRVVSVNAQAGTITVEANVNAAMGIETMTMPVWCHTNDQDDLAWYTMAPSSVDGRGNGVYTLTIDAYDHQLQSGEYELDLYVTEGNGVYAGFTSVRADLTIPELAFNAEPSSDGLHYTVSISGGLLNGSDAVLFPTWSQTGGQDDIQWYEGSYDARTRTWSRVVDLSAHTTAGIYSTHFYVTHKGALHLLGYVNYEAPTLRGFAEMTACDLESGTVTVKANVSSTRDIDTVMLAVWSEANGQDEIDWLAMKPSSVDGSGNGIYAVTFNIADHNGEHGYYAMHLYVTDRAGISQNVAKLHEAIGEVAEPGPGQGAEQPPVQPPQTGGYPIMGASATNVDQMVRMYNATGNVYPAAVYASKGAASIYDFCTILVEEAAMEGVRAEVLFSQVVLETGWLRFGGDVSAEQCNFGGIGATGGGVAGQSFPDVRTGLRAQVQHLKAYASTDGLVNACVDPRFQYVERGCAPTVDGLTHRWAMSDTYGDTLTDLIHRLAAY